MKNSYQLTIIIVISIFLSACAAKKNQLDRSIFQSNKIEVIRIDQLGSNLSAEKSNRAKKIGLIGGVPGVLIGSVVDSKTNATRTKTLAPLTKALGDYDINQQILDSLSKQLTGRAFAARVNLDTSFEAKEKIKAFLVPRLTPSVVMSADYSSVTVLLEVITYQNRRGRKPHRGTYSAAHVLDDHGEEVTKEDNFQFWLDNPEILIENISEKIDQAVAEFIQDYNLENAVQKN